MPGKFSGDRAPYATEWVYGMACWCQCAGVPEHDYVRVMISQLEGTAAQWQNFLDMEVLQRRRAPLQAWRDWATELVVQFEPMNVLERA